MMDRSPILGPAMRLIEDHLVSLKWDTKPAREPTDSGPIAVNEMAQAELVRQSFFNFKGGFPGFLRSCFTMMGYGFSLLETQWAIVQDPYDLHYRIPGKIKDGIETEAPRLGSVRIPAGTRIPRRYRWIAPWTLEDWVLDLDGDLMGALQRSEKGRVFIPKAKLQHYARGFYSDNWSGQSSNRPLHWIERAFSDECVSDRVSRERWGEGTLVAEWTGVDNDETIEYSGEDAKEMETMLQKFQSGASGYMVVRPGWKVAFNFGGTAFPDPIPRLQYYQHLLSKPHGDVVKDAGAGKFGTRAGLQVMATENQRQLSGICHDFCTSVTQEHILPIGRANGWREDRLPYLQASGFIDSGLMNSIFMFAQANLLGEREDDADTFRRLLGMET
jgi:hypothetical protein